MGHALFYFQLYQFPFDATVGLHSSFGWSIVPPINIYCAPPRKFRSQTDGSQRNKLTSRIRLNFSCWIWIAVGNCDKRKNTTAVYRSWDTNSA